MTGQSSPSPATGSERNEYVLASMPNVCAREHEPGRVCIRPDGHAPDTGWRQAMWPSNGWVDVCVTCGAVILDGPLHDRFHALLAGFAAGQGTT